MTEVLVSVRVPSSLLEELKQIAESQHFLDTSEALRSIIRQRWHREENPMMYEIDLIKAELRQMRPLLNEVGR